MAAFTEREWGAAYPEESVLIASGARPILYGAYRAVVWMLDTAAVLAAGAVLAAVAGGIVALICALPGWVP